MTDHSDKFAVLWFGIDMPCVHVAHVAYILCSLSVGLISWAGEFRVSYSVSYGHTEAMIGVLLEKFFNRKSPAK